jgi:hypothetical protein
VVFIHGDGLANANRDGGYLPLWESFARAGLDKPTAIAAHLWPSTKRNLAYAAALANIDDANQTWNQLDSPARRRAWIAATVAITAPFDADPHLPTELAASSGLSTRQANSGAHRTNPHRRRRSRPLQRSARDDPNRRT